MRNAQENRRRTRISVQVAAGLGMAGVLAMIATTSAAAHAIRTPPILHDAVASRIVTVRLWADQTPRNAGFNFDGYADGHLVVTVPVGWRVVLDFRNLAPLPHSLVVEPWNEPSDLRRPYAAFPGASTPDPFAGTPPQGAVSLHFTATRAGRYRLACALPGHRDLGMWDTLIVTARVRIPTVRVQD